MSNILCEGMTKFRCIIHDLTQVDPLRECITIASTAMRIFRKNYMEEDSIGVIPRNGYVNYQRQSRVGLMWLKWWAETHGERVTHNANGREHRIGKYFVDG